MFARRVDERTAPGRGRRTASIRAKRIWAAGRGVLAGTRGGGDSRARHNLGLFAFIAPRFHVPRSLRLQHPLVLLVTPETAGGSSFSGGPPTPPVEGPSVSTRAR